MGGGAIALSCKTLATASKLLPINETKALVDHQGWLGLSQWCLGCAKVKSVSRQYWKGRIPYIEYDWLRELSRPPRGHIKWEELISSWICTLDLDGYERRARPNDMWCPDCQLQLYWVTRQCESQLKLEGQAPGGRYAEIWYRLRLVQEALAARNL